MIVFTLFSPTLVERIPSAGTARWFTGCYINKEDACFDKKMWDKFDKYDNMDTEKENKVRAFPEPMPMKPKNSRLRTNAASKLLGLSVLLDPMLHDKINCT